MKDLTVMPGGEHWFHTDKQMRFLDNWLREHETKVVKPKQKGVKNMSEKNITIRLETKDDYRNVENLVREAFWNVYRPGCMEHYVLHCYRDDPAFVPELDFVMESGGEPIG